MSENCEREKERERELERILRNEEPKPGHKGGK